MNIHLQNQWNHPATSGRGLLRLIRDEIPANLTPRRDRLGVCAIAHAFDEILTESDRTILREAENYADGYLSHALLEGYYEQAVSHAVSLATAPVAFADMMTAAMAQQQSEARRLHVLDVVRDAFGQPFFPFSFMIKGPWVHVDPPWVASDIHHLDPTWLRDQTVRSLALAAYQSAYPDISPHGLMDPAALLVLADALEEAGCVAPCWECNGRSQLFSDSRCGVCGGNGIGEHPLVHHLRGKVLRPDHSHGFPALPLRHWRGCWAIDLLLNQC